MHLTNLYLLIYFESLQLAALLMACMLPHVLDLVCCFKFLLPVLKCTLCLYLSLNVLCAYTCP